MEIQVIEPKIKSNLFKLPNSIHFKIFDYLTTSELNAVKKTCLGYYRKIKQHQLQKTSLQNSEKSYFDILSHLPLDALNLILLQLNLLDLKHLLFISKAIRELCIKCSVWEKYRLNPLIITKRHILPSFSREIISLHVGHCGSAIGECFWKQIMKEHALSSDGRSLLSPLASYPYLKKANSYFDETREGKFKPRAIWIDLDTDSHTFPPLIGNEYIYTENPKSAFGWGSAHYMEGHELIEDVIAERIQKIAEKCDSLQGYHLFHSLGGGTGSGLGSALLTHLRENFLGLDFFVFSVIPSFKQLWERYNVSLGVHHLEDADLVFLFENGIGGKNDEELNEMFVDACSMITGPLRLGQMNMRRLSTLLVPYPRVKWFYTKMNESLHKDINQLLRFPTTQTINIDSTSSYAGYISGMFSTRNFSDATSFLKNNVKTVTEMSYLRLPDPLLVTEFEAYKAKPMISTTVTGLHSISTLFSKVLDFEISDFQRKRLVHGLSSVGMDEMELVEAESTVRDLISEYSGPWGASLEDEEEEM